MEKGLLNVKLSTETHLNFAFCFLTPHPSPSGPIFTLYSAL